MDSTYAKTAVASVLAGVIGLASYGVVRETQTIGEGKIVMATGSSQYYELAESYRRELERNGIKFEVQRRTEGFTTLKTLLDPNSGVNAGFIKGGLVGSLQGRLATEKAKGRYAEFEQAALGRAPVLRADLGVLARRFARRQPARPQGHENPHRHEGKRRAAHRQPAPQGQRRRQDQRHA